MQNVSIIIGTLDREQALLACLKSIRKFYPTIQVLVVDDGNMDLQRIQEKKKRLVSEFQVKYYKLANDAGAGKKRNMGMKLAKTKYVVVIDDDFIFTGNTNLSAMQAILDRRPDITIVGGQVLDKNGHHGTRGSMLARGAILNEDGSIKFRYFHRIKLPKPVLDAVLMGSHEVMFYPCDFVRTFMMIREDHRIQWDPDLKTNPDHIDFFLKIMERGHFKVVYCPQVSLKHKHPAPSAEYTQMRDRKDFWKVFYLKTGFRFGIFYPHGKVLIRDYKEMTSVPWAEIKHYFKGKNNEN